MIVNTKKTIIKTCLAIELVLFAWYYIFGLQGILEIRHQKKEIEILEQKIAEAHERTNTIQHDITQWNSHSFFKEKYAREQLQMARPKDEIYYF